MAKATYTVKDWHLDNGSNPIGTAYRNRWLYATLKGPNLTDCTIDSVKVILPKTSSYFPSGSAEFRMKYGGTTVKYNMPSSDGASVARTCKMTGAKDTMFKSGTGEVVFYTYVATDEGYLTIEDGNVTVEVEYTNNASKLTVPEKTVEAGSEIAFEIVPMKASYSHGVVLEMGSKSARVILEAGETTGSIPVPLDWLEIIPNAKEYTGGTMTIATYDGDKTIGTRTVTGITMVAPEFSGEAAPSADVAYDPIFTVDGKTYPDLGVGLVAGKSGIHATLKNAQAKYGATVAKTEIVLNGTTVATGTGDIEYVSDALTACNLAFIVTDSRGVSFGVSPRLYVHPYYPPSATLSAWRTNAEGKEDDFGTHGAYQYAYSYDVMDGQNKVTSELTVDKTTQVGPPTEGMLLPAERVHLAENQAYDVTLTVRDLYGETAMATVRVPSAMFLLHGNAACNGAGIGHVADKENALVVNPEWDVYMGGSPVSGAQVLKDNMSWSNGSVTIPGLSKWLLVQIVTGQGNILAFVDSGAVRGIGINTSDTTHRTLAIRASRDGDTLTMVTAHYINHAGGGNHSERTDLTVSKIVGLIRNYV